MFKAQKKFSSYASYTDMMTRCQNPNRPHFYRYGGRGIKVCKRWHKFENFYADMGNKPKNKSLDRIDNNGDYTPENCKWSSAREQANNRRNNIAVEIEGKKWTIAQWSRLADIDPKMVYRRYHKGIKGKALLKSSSYKIVYIKVNSEVKSLNEWAIQMKMHRSTLRYRYLKGVKGDELFAKPPQGKALPIPRSWT